MAAGSDFPFAPRRLPFHYGAVVIAAATGGVLFSIPGQTMGVSAFTDALLAATALDRLELSNAYLVGTLGSAALLPRAGVLLDRYGVRTGAVAAAVLLGAVLWLLAQIDLLTASAAAVLPLSRATLAFGLLVLLFTGLRFAGQGVLTLASNTMMSRWFRRRRGAATAIQATCVACGFAAAPWLFDRWITAHGWRAAWTGIAVVEVVGAALWAWLLFRETPESCGLAVDGGLPGRTRSAGTFPEAATTRAEALRTRAFWLISLGLALHGMVITGITLHVVDLGAEAGLSRSAAVGIFVPIAVVSTATGAFVGWLADRVTIRSLLLTLLVMQSIGYVAAAHLGTTLGWWAAVVALGAGGGLFPVLTALAHPRFFGRRHLGSIAGVSMSMVVVGSALGPTALAASRAVAGSYAPGLYAVATVPALLALLTAAKPLHPADHGAARAGVRR